MQEEASMKHQEEGDCSYHLHGPWEGNASFRHSNIILFGGIISTTLVLFFHHSITMNVVSREYGNFIRLERTWNYYYCSNDQDNLVAQWDDRRLEEAVV